MKTIPIGHVRNLSLLRAEFEHISLKLPTLQVRPGQLEDHTEDHQGVGHLHPCPL